MHDHKSGHRLKRNFLGGSGGNQINLLMAAAAFNFRKLMREIVFWRRKLNASKPALQILFTELRPQCTYGYVMNISGSTTYE